MRHKWHLVSLAICLTVAATMTGSFADAASVSARPSKPSLTRITSQLRAGKVDVTVTFESAATNPKSPIIATEVRVGTASCTARGNATTCTVRVPASHTYKVTARARNKNGFGSWSDSVAFLASGVRIWQRRTTATTPGGTTSTTSLKFNLKNAVGLTLKSTVSSSSVHKAATGSNLQVVDAIGTTTDAVSSGSANISKFLIAPNDKLYVRFSSKTTIGSVSCLLAEVVRSTGDPTCIDSELSSISWAQENTYEFEPIQFDDTGAIYYSGVDSTGKSTLRKYYNGVSSSLVTDNVNWLRFHVLPDGRVIVGGQTSSSNTRWTRLILTNGGLQNLVAGDWPSFLARFPDDNVYLGYWGSDGLANMGVRRFIASSSTMDSSYWISGNVNGVPRTAFFDVGAASGTPQRIQALEPYYGTLVRRLVVTSANKVYAITGTTPTLVQYFPVVSQPTTAVKSVGVMQRVLTYLVMSGTNAAGQNITTLYNTSTDTEQVLIPASNEIEVYHLNYAASSNKIMFDGLRFSDNKYVLGQVDLNTGQVSASQTGSSKLVDFQTFGS